MANQHSDEKDYINLTQDQEAEKYNPLLSTPWTSKLVHQPDDPKCSCVKCFDDYVRNDDDIIISKDVFADNRWVKNYAVIRAENLEEFILSHKEEERNFHELMFDGKAHKLFVDIDVNLEEEKNFDQIVMLKFLSSFIDVLEEKIRRFYPIYNPNKNADINVMVFSSSNEKKFSVHLHFNLITSFQTYTKYLIQHVLDCTCLMNADFEKYKKYFDLSVYRNGGSLRIENCRKPESDRVKVYKKIIRKTIKDKTVLAHEPNNDNGYYNEVFKHRLLNFVGRKEDILDIDDLIECHIPPSTLEKISENISHETGFIRKNIENEEIKELIDCYSRERAFNYQTWSYVGFALHNVFNGGEDGLIAFDEFSRKVPTKYNEDNVRRFYNSINSNAQKKFGYTSLVKWAIADKPDYVLRHHEWMDKKQNENNKKKYAEIQERFLSINKHEKYPNEYYDTLQIKKYLKPNYSLMELVELVANVLCVVVNGGNSLYYTKNYRDGEIEYSEIQLVKLFERKFSYFNKQEEKMVETTAKRVAELIYENNINTFKYRDFHPYGKSKEEVSPEIFNTFAGFKIEYPSFAKPNNIPLAIKRQRVLDHIRYSICNNVDERYEYFMNWWGMFFQYPKRKLPCLILYSALEGSGKTKFIEFFMTKIIGMKMSISSDVYLVLGNDFNGHMEDKLLCMMNESEDRSIAFKASEKFKNLISDVEGTIHRKKKDAKNAKSYCKYIITTNNQLVVKVPINDRRYAFFECNTDRIGDAQYFTELYDEACDVECAEELFKIFMERDVSQFHPEKFPQSDIKDLAMELSKPLAQRYLSDLKRDSEFRMKIEVSDNPEKYPLDLLYHNFQAWINYNQIPKTLTRPSFTRQINRFLPSKVMSIEGKSIRGVELSQEILNKLK